MIQDWRRVWGIGDFPFLFVQLANYNAPESDWPTVREGQRQALALRNTAMTVTIDVGTPGNIHPPDKKAVGTRLSLAARALAYGESIEYSGPLPRQVAPEGGSIRVWFDHTDGLTARGGLVRGFEVAGEDRKFVSAEVTIDGATVVARSPQVERAVGSQSRRHRAPSGVRVLTRKIRNGENPAHFRAGASDSGPDVRTGVTDRGAIAGRVGDVSAMLHMMVDWTKHYFF